MTAKEEYDRRKSDQNSAKEKKRSEKWRVKVREPIILFTGVLAISTIALVAVSILQWLTLRQTDETNRAVQRPYVTANDLKIITDKVPFYWFFQVSAENSGGTPTKLMRYVVVGTLGSPSDPELIFRHPTAPVTVWRGVLAPKTTAPLIFGEQGIPISTFSNPGRGLYYIYGAIHYQDQFEGTPEHLSKFCFAVGSEKRSGVLTPSYERCLFWNCMDEADCEADNAANEHYMDEYRRSVSPPTKKLQ